MKKLLFIFILFIGFIAKSQTYNPSLHTVTNKALGIAQANPTDARTYFYDATNFVYRAYVSTAEVISYLNLAKYRVGQFDIVVNTGGSLSGGVITGGTNTIWYFKDGTADGNLVQKIFPASSTDSSIFATHYDVDTAKINLRNSIAGKISTTLNAGQILVGNVSNVATPVTPNNDVSVTTGGSFTVNNQWKLLGNSGTSGSNDFIGTTDGVPLSFRIGNSIAGKLQFSGGTSFGYLAGQTDPYSTAIGYSALAAGASNSDFNTAVGYMALTANTTGQLNTALGHESLLRNTTGFNNVGIGPFTISNNSSGKFNTAVGYDALQANVIGNYNTTLGFQSGFNISGSGNIVIGSDSSGLLPVTTGSFNTIIGGNIQGISSTAWKNIILADGQGNIRLQIDSFATAIINSTTALGLPTGTTAQRPSSPAIGYIRYNTDSVGTETWNGSAWVKAGSGGGGGGGSVTSVATGLGLSGGPITGMGTLVLDTTYGGTLGGIHTRNYNDVRYAPISVIGGTNSNVGAGYRLAIPGTNNIKTVFPGFAMLLDSTSNSQGLTFKFDSTAASGFHTQGYNDLRYAPIGGSAGITQLTGDATAGPGSGSQAITFATVNTSPGTFLNPVVTVNAKGLSTAVSNSCQFPSETQLGDIYTKSSWTTTTLANDFIQFGAVAPVINGTSIDIDGSFGNFANYLAIPSFGGATALYKWEDSVKFRIVTTGYGIAIGTHAYNSGRVDDLLTYFNLMSSPSAMQIETSAGTAVSSPSSTLAWSVGDSICLTMSYSAYDTTCTATVRNISTNTTVTVFANPYTGGHLTNLGYFAVHSVGGKQRIFGIGVGSKETRNPLLAVQSDSKGQGAIAASFAGGSSQQLRTKLYHTTIIHGGQGDLLEDAVANLGEVLRLNPHTYLVAGEGRNSFGAGTTVAQAEALYDQIWNTFSPAGINVLFEMFPEGISAVNTQLGQLNTYLKTKYPANYIDAWDSMSTNGTSIKPTYSASDSIHPNQLGHNAIYRADSAAALITSCNNRTQQVFNSDKNITIVGNSTEFVGQAVKSIFPLNDSTFRVLYVGDTTKDIKVKGTATGGIPNFDVVLSQGGALTANRSIDLGGNELTIMDGGDFSLPFTVPNGTDVTRLGYITRYWSQTFSDDFLAKTGLYCCDAASNGLTDPLIPIDIQPLSANDTTLGIGVRLSYPNGNHGFLGSMRMNGSVATPKIFINTGATGGADETSPNASALFEARSTTQGMLFPRMNTTQMNAISSPATGLTIWNTDSLDICVYTGAAWLKERGGSSTGGADTLHVKNRGVGILAGNTNGADTLFLNNLNGLLSIVATKGSDSSNNFSLLNDTTNSLPANYAYSTNSAGRKGWYVNTTTASATFTSTPTNTTNISGASLNPAIYLRVGNVVHVTIGGTLTPTLISTSSVLTITLPFTTSSTSQIGVGSGSIAYNSGSLGYYGGIVNIASASTATFTFVPTVTTGSTAGFSFSFDYIL